MFVSEEEGFRGVNLINPDGTGRVRLTNDDATVFNSEAQFSPDGSKVYFYSTREDCGGVGCVAPTDFGIEPYPSQMWEMNLDGTGLQQRTRYVPQDNTPTEYLSFSLEGNRVVFEDYVEGEYVIKTANADGSNEVSLRKGRRASFSPNGKKIVYEAEERYEASYQYFLTNTDIYTANLDGTNEKRLTTGTEPDVAPVYSPDGSRIAFARNVPSVGFNIYVMNADGSDRRVVTNGEHTDIPASFSPDGKQILFSSNRGAGSPYLGDSPSRVCIINVDGTGLRALPERPGQTGNLFLLDRASGGAWARVATP